MLPEYNVLSDSSENFNHDSTRALDSMVSPENLSYNKNVSIFLLTFLMREKKLLPCFAVNDSYRQKLQQKSNISDHPLLSMHKTQSVSVAESRQHIQL